MKRDEIGNVPPHDIEAEMAVLGAMLLPDSDDAVTTALEMLTRADFYRPAHAVIFDAMFLLRKRQEPIDIITLRNSMEQSGTLEGVGVEYLLQLADVEFTIANVAYYAAIVKEASQKRQIIELISREAQILYRNDDTAPSVTMRRIEQGLAAIDTSNRETSSVTLYQGMAAAYENIERAMEDGEMTGVSYGLTEVNKITSGLRKSELTVVAARPGMGKTSLMMKSAHTVAAEGGVVAVFSLEMSAEQLCNRWYGSLARVNSQRIRKATLRGDELQRMRDARDECRGVSLIIADDAEMTATEIQTRCRKIRAQYGSLDLICIDYLLLMGRPEDLNRNAQTREIVTANARASKQLARHFNCPVMLLTQLSRKPEQREDKRPILSDLAESGAIEAEADVVQFLYRPSYYARKEQNLPDNHIDQCEVIVAKNRNGPTGIVPVAFLPAYVRFDDLQEGF